MGEAGVVVEGRELAHPFDEAAMSGASYLATARQCLMTPKRTYSGASSKLSCTTTLLAPTKRAERTLESSWMTQRPKYCLLLVHWPAQL